MKQKKRTMPLENNVPYNYRKGFGKDRSVIYAFVISPTKFLRASTSVFLADISEYL